jgi:hypothetical protein
MFVKRVFDYLRSLWRSRKAFHYRNDGEWRWWG